MRLTPDGTMRIGFRFAREPPGHRRCEAFTTKGVYMGLIKALTGAAGSVLADQWKEFFYCDAIDKDVLVVKGQKRISDRSSNTKGSDNIITNGSGIAVADGQAMIIVDNGKIVEFSAEPGQYTYDTSTEPTIFTGDLGQGILDSFARVGYRFTYGADTGHDQRVYYFNLKEIMGNKYGTATPIPFRVVDANIGLDIDISVRCNGEYSYKIVDPIMFYTNVCGNVSSPYKRSEIDSQLKAELLTALQPAFGKISAMGIRYSAIPNHTTEVADALNEVLSEKWTQLRGIKVVSFGVNTIAASEEDEQLIKDMQKAGALRDPNMRVAVTTAASADAMRAAAANEAGAMNGFVGMGMAGFAGNQFANVGAQVPQGEFPQYPNQYPVAEGGGFTQPAPAASAAAAPSGSWTCSCGKENTGKFCTECGSKKAESWVCSCGAVNTGKFCSECGKKRSEGVKCPTCGWTAPEGSSPKFCPECGSRL